MDGAGGCVANEAVVDLLEDVVGGNGDDDRAGAAVAADAGGIVGECGGFVVEGVGAVEPAVQGDVAVS